MSQRVITFHQMTQQQRVNKSYQGEVCTIDAAGIPQQEPGNDEYYG